MERGYKKRMAGSFRERTERRVPRRIITTDEYDRKCQELKTSFFTVCLKTWLGLLDTLRTPAYYNYLSINNTIFQEYGLVG